MFVRQRSEFNRMVWCVLDREVSLIEWYDGSLDREVSLIEWYDVF